MGFENPKKKFSEIREHLRGQQTAFDVLQKRPRKEHGREMMVTPEHIKKSIICFVGLPGSGKSTQIDRLQKRIGAPVFHLAKIDGELHLETNGKSLSVDEMVRKGTSLSLSELDAFVLDQVLQNPSKFVILDGFPRSPEQAQHLVEMAQKQDWQVQVVYLISDVKHAWKHQIRRAKNRDEAPNLKEFDSKINRSLRKDIPAINELEDMGISVIRADARMDKNDIEREISSLLILEEGTQQDTQQK